MINRLRENYTQVDNNILSSANISLKAKGLYWFLCSKPDDWEFNYNWLIKQLKEWEKSIRSAVKELVDAEVLLRIPKKNKNWSFDWWDWIINPTQSDLKNGRDPLRKWPKTEVPKTGSSENGEENSNTDLSNNNLSNIYIENEILNLKIIEFIENRKQLKKQMTKLAIDKLVNKVNGRITKYTNEEISNFFDTAIECWRQWVFEPKKYQKVPAKKLAYEWDGARSGFIF